MAACANLISKRNVKPTVSAATVRGVVAELERKYSVARADARADAH